MGGIRWGRDPRRHSFISSGFFLPLSPWSGMGVSSRLVDLDHPLPINFVLFQQWGQCWGHQQGHMVEAASLPLPLCPEKATGHAKVWQATQSCPLARAAIRTSQKSSWHFCNIISVCFPQAQKICSFGRAKQLSCSWLWCSLSYLGWILIVF